MDCLITRYGVRTLGYHGYNSGGDMLDEGTTIVKAFMAIAEDEPIVGKTDARLNLDNEYLKDEVSDLKKVIEKWTSSKLTLAQLLTEQIPINIVRTLGGKDPLPLLPKLSGAEPIEKESLVKSIKKKAQTKTPSDSNPKPEKKADSTTEELLLTLMKEVKGLKEKIKASTDNSLSVS
ncbi:hypothetical protein Tco_0157732 [Tanacetum coccineum]